MLIRLHSLSRPSVDVTGSWVTENAVLLDDKVLNKKSQRDKRTD